MSQEGFMVDLETAQLFFEMCHEHNITDERERVALMRLLVANKKAKYIRDPKKLLSGKKVWKIEGKKPNV